MKDLLRAVTHLALSNQPVTLSEMRELILRHLLSTSDEVGYQQLTRHLFGTYMQMLFTHELSESGFMSVDGYHHNRFLSIDKSGNGDATAIRELFKKNYLLGIEHGLSETGKIDTICNFDPAYVPPNLPLTLGEYPRDIVEQFAAVTGYMMATGRLAA